MRRASADAFAEPVIGDPVDLETYGRPSAGHGRADLDAAASRRRDDRHVTRARRFNSHRPRAAEMTTGRRRQGDDESVRAARNLDVAHTADGPRTVRISGQPTPARAAAEGRSISGRGTARRSISAQVARYDRRPDRAAQWALFMGVFMIVVAVATGG